MAVSAGAGNLHRNMPNRLSFLRAPPSPSWRGAGAYLLCYGLAALGGLAFFSLHTPLPWLLGALAFVALGRLSGLPVQASQPLRNGGMLVVGCALGLFFTPEASGHIAQHGLLVVASALLTLALGVLLSPLLGRLARMDKASALFGSIPGGVAEMSLIGEAYGARPTAVAIAQLLRVVGVVVLVPTAFALLGVRGGAALAGNAVAQDFRLGGFALLLAAGAVAAVVLQRIGMRNSWMLGGLLVSVGLTATGNSVTGIPVVLTAAAQVLLGAQLGVQFERAAFLGGGRLMAGAMLHVLLLTGLCTLLGLALGHAFGLDPATMVLATAPGGVAEMSITAKTLLLEVPVVVAFHLVRIFLTMALVQPASIMLRRVGFL
ncbi:AbrB family transcriptional regulator [Pseudoroseomonas wenyumeiae]|uniref:AbrB family transcriptional regulator n=2 Tax=Teichococcus wenyumeiae TaxID=2478470 RepID=A0A3A9J1F2_9PROT|nr:AbrB family transcriptional regulator [Pseudoroseomonas wenyumeiae]RMI26484.1 AbrB family transcriptional regulator [Pseudoroseomonas wenyumeiae]